MSDFVKIIGPYHCKHYDRTFDSQLREEMHMRIHFHFFPAFRRNQIQLTEINATFTKIK